MVARNVFRTAAFIMVLGSLPSLVFGLSAASARTIHDSETVTVVKTVASPTTDSATPLVDALLATDPRTMGATGRLRVRDIRIASPATP